MDNYERAVQAAIAVLEHGPVSRATAARIIQAMNVYNQGFTSDDLVPILRGIACVSPRAQEYLALYE